MHAVKARSKPISKRLLNVNEEQNPSIIEDDYEFLDEHEPSKPLAQTMTDLQLNNTERENLAENGKCTQAHSLHTNELKTLIDSRNLFILISFNR